MGARYSFGTTWKVLAPAAVAWDAISKPLDWPSWWRGVEAVEEIEPGAADGLGALHRYTWKSALPYRLVFDMRVTKVDEPVRLEGHASGELEGEGVWTFEEDAGVTTVHYQWEIETTRAWMNAFSWLLRPAFEWNHDWVMASGARGLSERIGVPVERLETRKRERRRWPLFLGGAVAGVAGLALLARRAKARS